jgi:hypothetical protein
MTARIDDGFGCGEPHAKAAANSRGAAALDRTGVRFDD